VIKHNLEVAGAQVRVYEFVPKLSANRPTLVFLHGLGDAGLCLKSLGTDVAAAGFRVLLPDAPGHGHSELLGDFSEQSRADSVLGVIEQLSGGPVVLGGHSMGGESAVIIASQRPAVVRGLIVEEPAVNFGSVPVSRQRKNAQQIRDWIEGLQSSTQADRIEWVRDDGPLWQESEYAPWARAKAQTNTAIFDANYHWLYDGASEVVSRLSMPTLLIRGEPTRHAMAARNAKVFVQLAPHTIDVMVAGAGHCVRRDNPIAYSAAIRGFLAQFA
jgi:pimeloyl-ACP methyl ester carboxylesterase